MKKQLLLPLLVAMLMVSPHLFCCTGITLQSSNGAHITGRTIDWAEGELNSMYVIVPRNYSQQSFTPEGVDGMRYISQYGYVGLAVKMKEFIVEGVNEKGLSGGLFYFPKYGKYERYNAADRARTISDMQLLAWILGSCKTVEEVKESVKAIHIIAMESNASTVHWRFTDSSGMQLVLEVINGKPIFYVNNLGVLTNAPGFDWQTTNLNNYVNLHPGSAADQDLGNVTLAPFGAGSGMLGLPGDMTPPSRFVRAAFYQSSAPKQPNALRTVTQCFQILNNFQIPIGIESTNNTTNVNLPSATQWSAVTDITNTKIYYRTMYNSTIRCIDLMEIDFERIKFRAEPLDEQKEEPIVPIRIK